MKNPVLPIIMIIFSTSQIPCNAQTHHDYVHRSRECRVYYSFIQKSDSLFIEGTVKDRQDKPVADMNVLIPEHRVGTVTNSAGEFSLYLPRLFRKGVILFDKTSFSRFDMVIEEQRKIKAPARTHHD